MNFKIYFILSFLCVSLVAFSVARNTTFYDINTFLNVLMPTRVDEHSTFLEYSSN